MSNEKTPERFRLVDNLSGLGFYDGIQSCENGSLVDYKDYAVAVARAESAEAEVARLREALTPSGDTKAAYISEVLCDCPTEDWKHHVPWTSIKEIMSMIRSRAALSDEVQDDG